MRRLPPRLLLADMRRQGVAVPEGEWLGSRTEGSARILLWRLPDGTLMEQRVVIYNVEIEKRRKGFRIVP